MNTLFYGVVDFQFWICHITGLSYEAVNIWMYCIAWPVMVYVLYMLLSVMTICKAYKLKMSVAVKAISVMFLVLGFSLLFCFPDIHYMLNNVHDFYVKCDTYVYALSGHDIKDYLDAGVHRDYVNVNVWIFIVLFPLYLLLPIYRMICTARKRKPGTVRINIATLCFLALSMIYGIVKLNSLMH